MKKIIYFALLFIFYGVCFGQNKFEKEIRINADEVPANALNFFDSSLFSNKIKWFKEFGYETTSIEAKFKLNCRRFSVEFSETGVFEDLEIEVKKRSIDQLVFENMTRHLTSKYGKYSIDKIQLQYVGDVLQVKESLYSLKKNQFYMENPELTLRYEVVVATKVDNTAALLEFLFDHTGAIIQYVKIDVKNTDNIEY